MNRREYLKLGGVTAAGMSVTGGATWFLTREGDDGGDPSASGSDGTGDLESTTDGEAPRADEQNTSQQQSNSNNESGQPDAANPEPEPDGPDTNESVINESAGGVDPTEDDVTISDTALETSSTRATVTGTVTNEADEPLTIDLEVQFKDGNSNIGRPALGGTTGLQPEDEWNFEISARGSEYSGASDYEIVPTVRI